MSGEEQWSLFLAYASDSQYNEVVKKLTSTRGELKMANELLHSISQDADVIASYRSRHKAEADWNHRKNYMEKKEKKARAEARAEGEAKGRAEGLAEVAKNLLKIKMPVQDIAKATGLSCDEVEKLRAGSSRE